MTANENMDRRSAEEPQQIPVNNYFDFDAGIMQACVARDFHYALLMPEPEQGYASIMKNSAAYQKFFAFLAQEHPGSLALTKAKPGAFLTICTRHECFNVRRFAWPTAFFTPTPATTKH